MPEHKITSSLREGITARRRALCAMEKQLSCGLVAEIARNVPDELQRLAASLMVLASEVRQAQRMAASTLGAEQVL